ncbi:CMRF35-like molecule 5 [Electrophorus electricus]|uniref:CMRF35-like molecule 5 n=1 Tax=Electrophorus electricus TaxID=8005 RepID=UPI0015D04FC8|nr:CMRF35-like molecule 5 [Electrophorus electricus]
MWTLILVLSSLFPAGTAAVTTVTGYKGRSVQIRCPYKSGYETHMKYLCRGECYTFWTKNIPVDSKSAKDKRFSLNDDTAARVFTVTITDLRSEDGGKYWCTTEQKVRDHYTEILLVVKVDTPMNVIVSHSTYTPPTPDPSTSVYTESTWSTGAHTVNGTNLQTNSPSLHGSFIPLFVVLVIITIILMVCVIMLGKLKKKKKTSKASPQTQCLHDSFHSHGVPLSVCDSEEIKDTRSHSVSDAGAPTAYSTVNLPTNPCDSSQTVYANTHISTNPCNFSYAVSATAPLPSSSPDQDTYCMAQLPNAIIIFHNMGEL